ncbi:leader peptidase (prepilin peptidase)/N-methyltransferase [Melghiribacillus thermohalophilus]|uniref:Leader peptidase (Prepilin peptidase)/N-methyltransferase n=2 Tax=Melghiribacillus thermohalophilus TaxID=1324956 RepID=A0A4R3MV34_9BACI|nr:leader peptidase (prepilin peptidase)/N-methyltransferase [Melghiribacillus thermohalophilus]
MLYVFILGLVLGSFFNVVGIRIPRNQSIVSPPSACLNCGRRLTPGDLIPVLSYIWLKGKCRDCNAGISPLYPVMELLTAFLFVVAFDQIGFQWELLVAFTLISLLAIVTVSDLNYMIIPDRVLVFFSVLFVVERVLIPLSPWYDSLLGAATGFLLLLAIAIVSKGGMGGGDIKLYAVIGYVLGLKGVLLSFFLAALIGSVAGLAGIIAGRINRQKPIPFAPFIATGSILAYFYSEPFYQWYLDFVI